MNFEIRALRDDDHDWVRQLLRAHWGATIVVSREHVHHADQLPGFLALGEEVTA